MSKCDMLVHQSSEEPRQDLKFAKGFKMKKVTIEVYTYTEPKLSGSSTLKALCFSFTVYGLTDECATNVERFADHGFSMAVVEPLDFYADVRAAYLAMCTAAVPIGEKTVVVCDIKED